MPTTTASLIESGTMLRMSDSARIKARICRRDGGVHGGVRAAPDEERPQTSKANARSPPRAPRP